jgi:GIY-YIG catalytic domain
MIKLIHKKKLSIEIIEKTGVFRGSNKLNGNKYIGSSTNLDKRFTLYYSLTFLQKQAKKVFFVELF